MFLGTGLSGYASDDELDHSVNIIGWGPCLVPEADDDNLCGTDYSTMIIGECWIVQNSWYVKKSINANVILLGRIHFLCLIIRNYFLYLLNFVGD